MEEEQEGDGDMQQNATPALDLSLARSKNSAGQLAPPRKTERLPSARGRHPILARGYQDDGTWAERSPGYRFIQAVRNGANTKSAAAYAGVARRTVYGWLEDKEHPTKEEQMYRDFLHQVEMAKASFLAELELLWRQAAKTDWRAAAALLAWRWPERWAEVLEHRRPEPGICDVRRLDHYWSCSTADPTSLGLSSEAEGLAQHSIESAVVVSARPAAIPGSAGTLPAGG